MRLHEDDRAAARHHELVTIEALIHPFHDAHETQLPAMIAGELRRLGRSTRLSRRLRPQADLPRYWNLQEARALPGWWREATEPAQRRGLLVAIAAAGPCALRTIRRSEVALLRAWMGAGGWNLIFDHPLNEPALGTLLPDPIAPLGWTESAAIEFGSAVTAGFLARRCLRAATMYGLRLPLAPAEVTVVDQAQDAALCRLYTHPRWLAWLD